MKIWSALVLVCSAVAIVAGGLAAQACHKPRASLPPPAPAPGISAPAASASALPSRERVYFIRSERGGPIKIGRSVQVGARLRTFQTAHADRLVVLATAPGDRHTEHALHQRFSRWHVDGEWYEDAPDVLACVEYVAREGLVCP